MREEADPAFLLRGKYLARVVLRLGDLLISTVPDMLSHVGVGFKVGVLLFTQDVVKPRIVRPVDRDDHRILRRALAPEELVIRVSLVSRVPGEPQL